jgi:hypothetical protein
VVTARPRVDELVAVGVGQRVGERVTAVPDAVDLDVSPETAVGEQRSRFRWKARVRRQIHHQ